MEIVNMTIPRATTNGAGDVELRFPYNAHFVERLKAEIPPHARSYDPADKSWTVAAPYAALAVALLRRRFPDARIERPGTRPGPVPQDGELAKDAVLPLLPTALPELIEGANRILARLHHPDRGDTDEAMQAINGAYAALRERVSA
jgi:hypothetical protein